MLIASAAPPRSPPPFDSFPTRRLTCFSHCKPGDGNLVEGVLSLPDTACSGCERANRIPWQSTFPSSLWGAAHVLGHARDKQKLPKQELAKDAQATVTHIYICYWELARLVLAQGPPMAGGQPAEGWCNLGEAWGEVGRKKML